MGCSGARHFEWSIECGIIDNMSKLFHVGVAFCLVTCLAGIPQPSLAQTPNAPAANNVDPQTRALVVGALIRELRAHYVFAAVAKSTEMSLRTKLKEGAYDAAPRPQDFADALTADLQQATHDRHLGVRYSEQPLSVRGPHNQASAAEKAERLKFLKSINYGIGRVEKLPGNIGYLEVHGFVDAQYASKAITAAMAQLADSAALVIDVRQNGGGQPDTVAFLCSYLLDHRTHINDFYGRQGQRTAEYWTQEHVPGPRYGQSKPVYVLTSRRTFSAAEEFSYDLQSLKRATLVGEVTGGGANPGDVRRLNAHFEAFVPTGRALNPITKTNWEGSGVTPEVRVPARDALVAAQKLALQKLAETEKDAQALRQITDRLAVLDQPALGPSAQALAKQPIYLRGSMNGWGTQNPLAATDAGQYSTKLALVPGNYQFKVASEDWRAIELGGDKANEVIAPGAEQTLYEAGEDIALEVKQAASYSFTVKVLPGRAPVLTVSGE